MEIILKKDVLNLGFANDIVSVKNGYARNYLFPRQLAVPVTAGNRKMLEENMRQQSRKLAKYKADAEVLAAKLNEITLQVKVKTSEEGTVYGSVSNIQIAEALNTQFGLDIDRKKINVPGSHIKELGEHKVSIPLQKDVCAEFTVEVVAE
ncbi:MAG: 50S ribosomal protein L9 [Lentimicrobiaceae bacterium]|nr:50S ribosomal protein L9 [Lentimicrobiaceae bacterium]